jgi:hypothetical protein
VYIETGTDKEVPQVAGAAKTETIVVPIIGKL